MYKKIDIINISAGDKVYLDPNAKHPYLEHNKPYLVTSILVGKPSRLMIGHQHYDLELFVILAQPECDCVVALVTHYDEFCLVKKSELEQWFEIYPTGNWSNFKFCSTCGKALDTEK